MVLGKRTRILPFFIEVNVPTLDTGKQILRLALHLGVHPRRLHVPRTALRAALTPIGTPLGRPRRRRAPRMGPTGLDVPRQGLLYH